MIQSAPSYKFNGNNCNYIREDIINVHWLRWVMNKFKTAFAVIIVITMLVLCQQIIVNATTNQTNKVELAELSHIRYGLMSIDSWKTQLSVIVTDEIDKLQFTKDHEKNLKFTVEKQLYILIDKVNKRVEKTNEKTLKGRVKNVFIDTLVDVDDIKKGIPQYADAMIKEMKKPQTQGKFKDLLKDKLEEYINQTYDGQDMSQVNRILLRMNAIDIEDAKMKLENEIILRYGHLVKAATIIIILAIILFLIPAFDKGPLEASLYISFALALTILLATGVTTPMIDMEAKISQMSFVLLDHPVKFDNQVLFFQSKSVLDVFWIMITHKDLQMKAVGILMVLFSIVFPICKLGSSVAYYYNYKNAKEKGLIKWFVLKSGKWSMADVLVVAIFMAYIGFNGIISSQFGKLQNATPDIVILTTNGTSLQPGFYIFLTYAILALFLSVYLTRKEAT